MYFGLQLPAEEISSHLDLQLHNYNLQYVGNLKVE